MNGIERRNKTMPFGLIKRRQSVFVPYQVHDEIDYFEFFKTQSKFYTNCPKFKNQQNAHIDSLY